MHGVQAERNAPPAWVVAVVLGGALLVRGTLVVLTQDDVIFRVPYLDAAFYHFWARSLATGAGDFVDAYFLGPLYPHVLSWWMRLGIMSPFDVRLVQAVLGVVNVFLVLQLGWRLHSPRAGVVAAVLLIFQGTVVLYEGFLVMETLVSFLVLLGCALVLLPGGTATRRFLQALAAGLCLGAATAGRATFLLLLPVVLWILWRRRMGAARSTWVRAGILVLAWGVALIPVLVHNASRGAPWTLTTNGGVNFYAGNNPESRGRFRPPPGVEFFTAASDLPAAGILPPAVAARSLTTAAVAGTEQAAASGKWLRESARWIRSAPGDYLLLLGRKCALVLQGREIGQIESPAFQLHRLTPFRALWVGWSVLLPLAFLGLWMGSKPQPNGTATREVAVLLGTLLLPCVIFFVTARYRLVAVPLACVLAGMGVACLASLWTNQRRRFWIWGIVLGVLAAGTRLGAQPAASAPAWENAQMAERMYAAGDLDGAIAYQQKASQLAPGRREVQLNLALYWSERGDAGDLVRAEQLLRRLAQEHPTDVIVLFNWGSVLDQSGNRDGARRIYQRVLELDPTFVPARRNLQALSTPGQQ